MEGTWDLSYLYTGFDDPAFAADMQRLPELVAELRSLLDADLTDAQLLGRYPEADQALFDICERLSLFVHLTLAVDAGNVEALQQMGRLQVMMTEVSLLNSAVNRRIGSMEDLDALIEQNPRLHDLAFILREKREKLQHQIPEQLEKWVRKLQLSGSDAFSQLRRTLDANLEVAYRDEKLPLSGVRGLAFSPDMAVRRDAYEAELAAYKQIEEPMAACLNAIKQEARTIAEMRGYASVLDMTLADSRMDRETLDAMWTAIREYLPQFRRYFRVKGQLLGHKDGLPFYDLFAPVGESVQTYTIEEARAILLREMGKFTPEMAAFIDNAFEQRWIDLYPRAGKSGGAFCAGANQFDRSLVMTNFQGSFNDISTIAHELGHAWHNRCMAGLHCELTDMPMPLAETASIFNETMLAHQILKTCTPEEELTIIEADLSGEAQVAVDIYSRFLFESAVIDKRADHAMTVDELKEMMLWAQAESYGDGLQGDVRHPYMWACKSHYYSAELNFYNFPYAFGSLFGKGVFAQYLKQGEAFIPKYNQLLRTSGSMSVADAAASVGLDVRSADFWRGSLAIISERIDRFCELCAAKMQH